MIKYVDTKVTFSEVPDEISLCINISNCPNHCEGCHSPYLAEDIGNYITIEKLLELCESNKGITCVCFMGGDADTLRIAALSDLVKRETNLKTAWYSGKSDYNTVKWAGHFDYIKMGKYIEALGPLSSKTTNQSMFKVIHKEGKKFTLEDITYKFRKDD